MSAPSDGARADARKRLAAAEVVAPDERIVTVLADHTLDRDAERMCDCGEFFADAFPGNTTGRDRLHRAHVAVALAGVIADAKAEALRDAADSLEGGLGVSGIPQTLYDTRVWLRARAGLIARTASR